MVIVFCEPKHPIPWPPIQTGIVRFVHTRTHVYLDILYTDTYGLFHRWSSTFLQTIELKVNHGLFPRLHIVFVRYNQFNCKDYLNNIFGSEKINTPGDHRCFKTQDEPENVWETERNYRMSEVTARICNTMNYKYVILEQTVILTTLKTMRLKKKLRNAYTAWRSITGTHVQGVINTQNTEKRIIGSAIFTFHTFLKIWENHLTEIPKLMKE